MKSTTLKLMHIAAIAIMMISATSAQAQRRPYRVSDREVQTQIDKLETDVDAFRTEVSRSMARSGVSMTPVTDFEDATDKLKTNFTARRSTTADVQEVLNRGASLSSFMNNNRMSMRSTDLWTTVRTDLDTLAGYYNLTANWNGGGSNQGSTRYTATSRQMRDILNRLKQRSLTFRQSYERWNNQYDRPNNPSASYDLSSELTNYDAALNNLSQNYRKGGNVDDVLRAAAPIDRFVNQNQTNASLRSNWSLVRSDLDTLAGYYSVRWDWNDRGTGTGTGSGWQGGNLDNRLTGTYRLNTARSDTVNSIVDTAIRNANYNATQREQARRNLERRLTAPDMLVFDMHGPELTMAGRNGQTVTLNVDGVPQTETSKNGRTITTTVTATDRELTINYEGERTNDYYVSFAPSNNGQLRVTRRLYLENQNQTVTAVSVYDRISPVADWNSVGRQNNLPLGMNVNSFIVPNNTQIIAILDQQLSTRSVRDGDHFSMTVNSPSTYAGAVIEGTVSGQRSGTVAGRANMALNFNTIRMRGDSRIYNFAGVVEQVRNTNGDVLNVNNEGLIRDSSSQTNKTVTRAGIGAVLGGIIGAIAGGGSGAAIGATVGAGAGAGSVVLQGKDNLELMSGSEFTITATSPNNVGQPLIR